MIDPAEKRYVSSSGDANAALDPTTSHGIMARLVGHGKRVLDVGCATGYLSRHLTDGGNRVTGIDVDERAVEEARHFCERAIAADLDLSSLGDVVSGDSFDAIVFGDVLEHVRDPWKLLTEARSFLSPRGFVVLSIPNVAHGNVRLSLLRGAFDYARFGLLDDTHLRFFTLRSVRELCIRAGFRIESIERTKVPLFDDTELVPPAHEREFGADVLAEVRRDPEHDTLQFVIRAVPVADGDHLRAALDELVAVETKLAAATATNERLERLLEDRAELVERVEVLSTSLAEREGELGREVAETELLRARIAAFDAELAAEAARAGAASTDERVALAEEIAALRTREAEREEEVERLRAETTELRSHLIEASRSVGEAYALRSAVDRAHETLASVHDAMQAKVSAAEGELAHLRSVVSQAEIDGTALRTALAELRRDYESLDASHRDSEQRRESLAARLAEVEHLSRTRETAAAATLADLRRALEEKPEAALRTQRATATESVVAIVPETFGSPVRGQAEALARLDAELQQAERAKRTMAEAFSRHLDADTSVVRAEMAEIDMMIRRIQSGRFWSAKSALGRVRRALPGGRARV